MKRINSATILAASIFFAADTGGKTGGGAGTAVAPGAATESPKPTTDGKAKTTPEAKVHTELMAKIKLYDESVSKAESYYIEVIEIIQSQKISRADVVQTLMKARGITFETAQTQYSKMKGIWQNPEVLKQLKEGTITLKMARQKTTNPQAATVAKAAGVGATQTGGGESKESKEARYDRTKKAHVAAVKECGYDLKSALMSFEADLKAAGIK